LEGEPRAKCPEKLDLPTRRAVGAKAETLHMWVRQAKQDQGLREGLSSNEREWLRSLEREKRELKRANEILRQASACFARAELDSRRK